MESWVNILRPIVKGMQADGLQSKAKKPREAVMDYGNLQTLILISFERKPELFFITNIVVFGPNLEKNWQIW